MKMTQRAKKALRASIRHWILDNLTVDDPEKANIQGNSCELCAQYRKIFVSCEGCPVAAYTGMPGCIGTPWHDASGVLQDWSIAAEKNASLQVLNAYKAAFQREAARMIVFMEKLLDD